MTASVSEEIFSDSMKGTIVVIGTGHMGRALTCCFVRSGYRVIVASRNPERNRKLINDIGGEVEDYENAWHHSSIVVAAIPFEGFENLPKKSLVGKIVVDVSNRPIKCNTEKESLAIRLQSTLPESRIVKAFNTLSANALSKGYFQGSKEVPICSSDSEAKTKIISFTRELGFSPVDFGSLANAKFVENIPVEFFPEWKFAGILALIIYIISFMLPFFRRQLCPNFAHLANGEEWDWNLFLKLPLTTIHFSFGLTSFNLLTSCYAPGVIASYLQLYRRTKYLRFPNWLDKWLKARKYIGILAFLFAYAHYLLAMVNEIGYGYKVEWTSVLYFLCGVTAFTLMTILGVTTIPSVEQSLTWREFSFIHRYLGWNCLFFATCHFLIMKWEKLFINTLKCYIIPDAIHTFLWYPLITILLKLPLLLPNVDAKLQKIRRGYEEKNHQGNVAHEIIQLRNQENIF